MIIRALALFCLLNFAYMSFVEEMHKEGLLLCKLQNLPHRGLGILYWTQVLEPQRADFVKDYLVQYQIAVDSEFILEGSKRPVMPCYAAVMARRFPRNQELQIVRDVIMQNHFRKLEQTP